MSPLTSTIRPLISIPALCHKNFHAGIYNIPFKFSLPYIGIFAYRQNVPLMTFNEIITELQSHANPDAIAAWLPAALRLNAITASESPFCGRSPNAPGVIRNWL
jgi:hypothetical protein